VPLINGDEIHLLIETDTVLASDEIAYIFVVIQDMSKPKQVIPEVAKVAQHEEEGAKSDEKSQKQQES